LLATMAYYHYLILGPESLSVGHHVHVRVCALRGRGEQVGGRGKGRGLLRQS